MKGSQKASARFAALVTAAGQPHVVTLWTRPEEDPEFMKAVRGHRVLTVHQETTGARKDYGEAGFRADGHSSHLYLVFPKSIQDFEGKRVVGIKYDLLTEAKPRGPVTRPRPNEQRVKAAAKKEPPAPKPEPRYAVAVQRTATETVTVEVTARTVAAARKLALARAGERPMDVSPDAVRTRILSMRKVKNQ